MAAAGVAGRATSWSFVQMTGFASAVPWSVMAIAVTLGLFATRNGSVARRVVVPNTTVVLMVVEGSAATVTTAYAQGHRRSASSAFALVCPSATGRNAAPTAAGEAAGTVSAQDAVAIKVPVYMMTAGDLHTRGVVISGL